MLVEMSIGPVQGFVAEARRTRDLWGGSYLLSLLSGHAMAACDIRGGKVVLPVLDDDPLYAWIRDPVDVPPPVGSLPNHFVAEVDGADHGEDVARHAAEAVIDQWSSITQAVWGKYLHGWELPSATRAIWDRQTKGFWNIRWVVRAPDEHASHARRKLWNTRWIPDEDGDKCTVMHDYQELSGFVRSAGEAASQDQFWKKIQEQTGPYDLRDGERLCAVALVKRLFPRVEASRLGWKPPDVVHWPSTSHLGIQPWLRAIAGDAPEVAERLAGLLVEDDTKVASRRPVCVPGIENDQIPTLRKLDPRLFTADARASSPEVNAMLEELTERIGDAPGPSQFYALMIADGDHLGRLVAAGKGGDVSRALADFTAAAPGIVASHHGVTVYAGGDDVLAMLAVPDAMACADELSSTYRESFEGRGIADATLSAGVVFAHARFKMVDVISMAHRLIEDVAKEQNGRDSLAAGLLRPGGLQAVWTSTWSWNERSACEHLDELVGLMRSHAGGERTLSQSAIHGIRSSLSLVCGWPRWTPGRWESLPVLFGGSELVAGVLSHDAADSREELHDRARLIWDMVRRHPNTDPGQEHVGVGIDALVLAGFLANGWQESPR